MIKRSTPPYLFIYLFYFFLCRVSVAQHQNALRMHVKELCSPLFDGRFTGSIGQKLSAIYIQNQFDSVTIDVFESVTLQHGGFLVNKNDTLYHRRDFLYAGLHTPMSQNVDLDSFDFIVCDAVDLFTLKNTHQNNHVVFMLRNWSEFLELFGHDFSNEEIILKNDLLPKPLHLFVNHNKLQKADSLYIQLLERVHCKHSENIIVPVYYNAKNSETWVLTAHYDHLGSNYPGADDNASGVSVLLTLAKLIKDFDAIFPVNVTLVFFSAEEQGLLGSRHFVNYSTFYNQNITRCFNFDMVGFVDSDKIQMIQYLDTVNFDYSSYEAINALPQEAFLHEFSSDHRSFVDKNIPSHLFFTGLHVNYHTPKDTPEKLNYDAMNEFVNWFYRVLIVE